MCVASVARSKWDISLAKGNAGEAEVLKALTGMALGTVEVKRDARAATTGNLYVEYAQHIGGAWIPSGISVTGADAWAFVLPPNDVMVFLTTDLLKHLALQANERGRRRITSHPDDIPTAGALVPLGHLFEGNKTTNTGAAHV